MIKKRSAKITQNRFFTAAGLGIELLATSGEICAQDLVEEQAVLKQAVFQHLPGHGDQLALSKIKSEISQNARGNFC